MKKMDQMRTGVNLLSRGLKMRCRCLLRVNRVILALGQLLPLFPASGRRNGRSPRLKGARSGHQSWIGASLCWPMMRRLYGAPRSMKMGNIRSPWRYDLTRQDATDTETLGYRRWPMACQRLHIDPAQQQRQDSESDDCPITVSTAESRPTGPLIASLAERGSRRELARAG